MNNDLDLTSWSQNVFDWFRIYMDGRIGFRCVCVALSRTIWAIKDLWVGWYDDKCVFSSVDFFTVEFWSPHRWIRNIIVDGVDIDAWRIEGLVMLNGFERWWKSISCIDMTSLILMSSLEWKSNGWAGKWCWFWKSTAKADEFGLLFDNDSCIVDDLVNVDD